MNNIVEQYINNVKRELYHLIPAKEYILDLRTNLEEYMQQFPGSTYLDLVEQFGSPKSVAEEFIANQNPNTPKERAKQRKKVRLFVICTLVIITLLICLVVALSGNRQAYYTDTTIIEEEIEVPEE